MIEALWAVYFETPKGDAGGGVMVIDTRGVYGGDSSFSYLGTAIYDSKSETISGDVEVRRHTDGLPFIFPGFDGGTYRFSGKLSKPVMFLQGICLKPLHTSLRFDANGLQTCPKPKARHNILGLCHSR